MQLDEAIRNRRSIRSYQSREVSPELIGEMLDLARHAPSAMNGQPWHFVVIRDREVKERLSEIKRLRCPLEKRVYVADYLKDAPLVVAICVERSRSYDRELENGLLAAAFLMLAATSRGLGSVYLSASRHGDPQLAADIVELLDLSSDTVPVSLVPIGFPAERPSTKELRPLSEMIAYV